MLATIFPLETHLTHAMPYHKSCYIGQEVIARTSSRSHVWNRWALLGSGGGATTGILLERRPGSAAATSLQQPAGVHGVHLPYRYGALPGT